MVELIFAVAVMFLCHSGRGVNMQQSTLKVDRIELNHYPWVFGEKIHQVILWQWNDAHARYVPVKFYFVPEDGSRDPVIVDGNWQFVARSVWSTKPSVVYQSKCFFESETDCDPWKKFRMQKLQKH